MRCVAGFADRPRAAACRREWSRRHRLLGGDGSSLPLSTASASVGGDSPGMWASRHVSRSNPSARIAKASDGSRWIKLIQGAISRITSYPCSGGDDFRYLPTPLHTGLSPYSGSGEPAAPVLQRDDRVLPARGEVTASARLCALRTAVPSSRPGRRLQRVVPAAAHQRFILARGEDT